MSDGSKGGAEGGSDLMNQVNQGQLMLSQQNMASLQHQQALQMQQQAAAAQQQANMESLQTSQAQSVNQTQALLVNTANLHQQLQNSNSGSSGQGGLGNQGGSQGGGTTNTMCLQPQSIPCSMASSPGLHQPQQIGSISLQGTNVGGNQSGSATITTMSTLPQQQAAAPQQLQQVQVIQQPMQNAYVQQLYNTQGQMLMSAIHPNMNPGSIQVIAAGKPFQSNQLTSHVLSKPVLAANAQQGSFPSYATIPTTSNQTLVITGGQLGVISGQLPHSQPKPQDLQKVTLVEAGGGGGSGQVKGGNTGNQTNQQVIAQNCVSHPMLHQLISPIQTYTACNGRQGGVGNQGQAQAVQIASPWQLPQIPLWTTHSPHQVIPNQIFIRGPQQDQPMFIQPSPPPSQSLQQQQQPQQNVGVSKQDMKSVSSPQVSRTLSILPSTSLAPPIRPATSAATQIVKSQQIKMRTKAILTKSNIPPQKDAQNQTKPGMQSATSQQLPPQILPGATKMIITSQGTIVQGPIDNKMVGQVTGTQSQTATAVAMPQAVAAMPQAALAMPQTAVSMPQTVVHQPQLIQPKPPALIGMSMPSLEPIPAQVDKSMEAMPSMEVVQGTPAPSLSMPTNEQVQERLAEQVKQDDTVNLVPPTLTQENGPGVNESKGAEPMEVVEPDPTPPVQPSVLPASSAPLTNGLSTGAMLNSLPSSMPPTSVTYTATVGSATPVRASSPAVSAAVLPSSQINGQQLQSHDETKEKRPPKAMIKPHNQVLTHIIEGYVIQESSEPFPINRTNLVSELSQPNKGDSNSDSSGEPPVKKASLDLSIVEDVEIGSDQLKCEVCNKIDLKEKFKKKRFCSTQCARRGSSSGRKRSKSKDEDPKTDKEWTEVETETPGGVATSDSNSENSNEPLSNPLKWTVAEVCDFIKNLPGCKEYAEDFAIQEIDGQALILLKPDHLMSAMSMKLGPALKICAKIDTMRTDNQNNSQTAPV